jgi:putative DNA primase/helicase
MTAATLADRLHATRAGGGWMARCPAHDDRHASLSIGAGDDGRVLLHCHARCTPDAICAAAGLELRDLFPETAQPRDRTIVATYDYQDEQGALLFQVVRFDPKDFRPRRPDGTWTLRSVRRVVFGLPALQGQTVVYVVEGERDAQGLQAIGLVATTNVGGAGQWRPAYVDQLRAAGVRSVVVLPDNDDPGRLHGDTVARSCYGAGLDVTIVALPDLPPKGDVSDWLAAGHTGDDLLALVRAAPRFAPVEAVSSSPPGSSVAQPVLVRLADVQPEPVTWIWPGRVAAGKLALLVGDPGLGKSWISLDIAARLSTGRAWPDAGSAPAGSVLLLSAEDGLADTIRPRLDALGGDATQVHHLAVLRTGERDRAVQLADVASLELAIHRIHARLMIIDPISAYLGSTDSHRDAEVRGLIAPLAALAERTGAAILGIMHLAKDRQQPAIYRAVGSIAFAAAARLVLAVAADPDREDRRIMAPVKSNLSTPPAALAYRLDAGRVIWEAEPVPDADVDALLAGPALSRQERRDAEAWLSDLLTDGPMRAQEVQAAAREAGLAWRTVERAKRRLDVEATRVGGVAGGGQWWWRLLPAKTATASMNTTNTATPPEVAVLASTSAISIEKPESTPKTATGRNVAALDRLELTPWPRP